MEFAQLTPMTLSGQTEHYYTFTRFRDLGQRAVILCPHGPPSPRKKFLLCRDASWIGYGHRRDPIYLFTTLTSGFGLALQKTEQEQPYSFIQSFYLIDKSSSNLCPKRS